MTMERRFAVGTVTNGNFEADTLGNDPDQTTFDARAEAIRDVKATIISADRIDNAAVYDNVERRIVWRQDS